MGKTKQQLIVDNNASFPNNNANYITPALLRDFNRDMIDNTVNQDVYTADSYSFDNRIDNLEIASASFVTSAITASSLTTASFAAGTITFTKGDGSTFGVVIPDVSGSTLPDGTVSGSAQIAALGFISSSVTSSMAVSSSLYAVTASIAREVIVSAVNANQSTLPIGTVVRISGANGDNPQFNSASYDTEVNSSNTLGILANTAVSGQFADVTVIGKLVGVNTQGMNAGDLLYLSSSGKFTNVQPQAPLQIVVLGEVLRVQQNNGSIFVNISNGWELNELHNVRITNPLQGDLLVYEATSSLWKNIPSSSIAGGTTINTGSFATTGSNTFYGDEIISGNLDVRDNIYAAYIDMKNAPNGNGGSIFFRASGSNVITGSSEFWSLNPIFQDGDLAIVVQPSNEKAISFGLKDGYTKFWKGLRLESGFDGWDIGNTPLIISSSFGGQTEMLDVKGNVSASNLNLSGALTASILEGYALVGGVGNVSKLVATSSFGGGTTINTGSFATTGSNAFVGNQTITGSVTISGSAQSDLTVVGQIFVSSSATAGTTTPRITVSGSAGTSTINRNSISTRNATDNGGMFPSTIYTQDSVTTDEIGFTVDPSVFGITEWSTGPAFYVNNTAGDTYPAVFGFQNKANYTDGRVEVLTPLVAQSGSVVTGSINITETLTLGSSDPLPTGTIGMLAVSASHLWFYNGAWTQLD